MPRIQNVVIVRLSGDAAFQGSYGLLQCSNVLLLHECKGLATLANDAIITQTVHIPVSQDLKSS